MGYPRTINGLIRVVNRPGRDYSFEVMRARMLYAHGRFERKLDRKCPVTFYQRGIPADAFGMMTGEDLDELDVPAFLRKEPPALPLGVDLSTLVGLIEQDEI